MLESSVSSNKLKLFELLLKKRGIAAQEVQEIQRRDAAEPCPLSFAQQRLWFLDQLEPNSSFYNLAAAVRLTGELNVAALAQSLSEIVARHETLRTTFSTVNSQPMQVISAPQVLTLPVIDISAQQEEVRRLVREEGTCPFDLEAGPLLRVQLLGLSEREHVLLLTMHHIVSDGWSMGVLVRELCALYEAFSQGQESPLAPLGVQYADYAQWQREHLVGEVLEQQLEYWRKQLAGTPALLELPADHARPAVQSFRGARESVRLGTELTQGLKELSRAEGVTLFMTLLGAFAVLLWRYTGASDVVVGTPVANRGRREVESLIGFFVNTLPLRMQVTGDESFAETVGRVREVCLGGYAHQEVPFERVVEELGVERRLSQSPLFQVMFALQNAPLPPMKMSGLEVELLEVEVETAKFDLTVSLHEDEFNNERAGDPDGGWIAGGLTYNTDLFEAATIKRLWQHYRQVLESVLRNPNVRLREIELLSGDERRQQLEEWNATEVEYPRESCLPELFEAQVERTPDAAALVYKHESLTFADLNERANRLAHHLRKHGVKPETLVGLCIERSPEMIIGLLAVLKAGGAYVPLDPTYPKERLSFMLTDAGVSVLLTQEHLIMTLPDHQAKVICLDRDWTTIAGESAENPRSGVEPDNLAYVIYTSGSTGRPKGVQVFHRGLSNLSVALNQAIYSRYQGRLKVSLNAPLSFDASVKQILTLVLGHTLHIVPEEIRYDAGALSFYIHSNALDVLDCTPSQLAFLLNGQSSPEGRAVPRIVLCGGEAINEQFWTTLLHTSETDFYNVYGPTECTVDAAIGRVQLSTERPNIGRPVANTQIYILDDELEPVPVGASGELYISGVGLARGYLHRPELTATRFLPHPFSREAGQRLYRTGDLGRFRASGEIEYLGRADQQVKVRGYRIELGEIEQVLCEQAGVRQAAVVVRESEQVGPQLVAYVCGEAAAVSGAEMRERVREQLPEYMVPQAVVVLDELPLLPNGKVDRRRLQELEVARAEVRQEPRTAIEELVCGIWAEVLGVEQVGVAEDFFELGGHSLLATQVMSRVREVFGVEVPLRRLFEFPTVAGLAQTVTTDLQQGSDLKLPEIKPAPDSVERGLSFAQHRLWFLNYLEPDSVAYNMPIAVRMIGRLDVAALKQSVNEIVSRHEAVRTTFRNRMGQPVPIVSEAQDVEVSIIDLSPLSEKERDADMLRLARREARLPFDLAQGPLLRITLLRLSDEEHVILVTMHHIISDGWSLGVFIREMVALYEGFLTGTPARLPELPIQYQDFAHWQRQWLNGDILKKQLDYWKHQLAGAPPVIELPTDRPRPLIQSFRGALKTVQFSRELATELGKLSRHENVTLFITLAAAFQTLLHRYTRQIDICIGVPIANRTRTETEGLIGFFVNTLVLRTDLSGRPTFKELLRRVRETALEAYAHQDVPFEMLVEELQPERNLSHAPLFQVMFVLQNARDEKLELPGLRLVPLETDSETAKFDLTVSLRETEEGLNCTIEYSTDLFNLETVERLGAHYENLLHAIVADPEMALEQLPLLSAAEVRQQLEEWNEPRVEFKGRELVHELFEQQVRRTPDAVALVHENVSFSYAELNARANQLAHYLRRYGVGPESLVGILMERSVELVVGLLGVLKAGAAYVPLDPGYPVERLSFMVADAGASVLLTQEQLAGVLPEPAAKVICVDRDWVEIARETAEDFESGAGPRNLAYVIYTSGSTGKPKGVLVTHENVCRLFSATSHWFDFNAKDVWTLFHSFAFDFSVWEIWGALLFGGRLVIVPFWISRSPDEFYSMLVREGVTVLNQTPSAFRQLMQAEERMVEAGSCEALEKLALRLVIFGGEALDTGSLADWFARHGDEQPQLVNMYGITETTVHVTYRPIRIEDAISPGAGSVIGRAIPDLQVYVLDEFQQLVPAGVIGELFVGGEGVARGYLHRAELTAERFVPDGFSRLPGAHLYRSGDLGRYRQNGDLEYMGRGDQQVKVRGFRIELGEIEAVLSRCAGVRECVVLARAEEENAGGPRSEKRIVAYVVTDADSSVTVNELRHYLKEKLPEYMVPASFVFVDKFVLTENGKIDRRALPSPERLLTNMADEQVAPLTPVEEVLTAIWGEVLGIERVNATDDFFELGGHSLLTTQVASRINHVFQVELQVRTLFEKTTIAELATTIEKLVIERTSAPVAWQQLLPRARNDNGAPLSFAQQRLWFLDQLQPGVTAYNIPGALRLRGPLNLAALEQSLNEIIARHETLRTVFSVVDGQPVQWIRTSLTIPIVSTAAQAEQVRQLTREEAGRPFDLEAGPLLRVRLLGLSEGEHVLLLTMHHIVSDGWSMGVLVRELCALYEAFSQGQESPLAALEVQYADYAQWQREHLVGEVLEQQLEYWRKQLVGAPALLELPSDHARPAVQSFRGARESVRLGEELTQELKELSRAEGVTLFMTLLGAFAVLLWRYTGAGDVVVGTPVANRGRREVESLIGFFVNTLPLRMQVTGDESFAETVGRVREVCLGGYAHQEVPFERVVEELGVERRLSQSPLFQVMFALQNAPLPPMQMSGLEVELLGVEVETAKFDLTVSLSESEGELSGVVEYSTDLFERETIERFASHYVNLLESVARNPQQHLREVQMLSANERAQLLQLSPAASAPVDATCIHELFEQQVRQTPDSVALVYDNDTLTYAELNARANQLAHYLRRHGIGPESLVGIMMDRSLEMLVAVLATLKAGAAYVPLDPAYPRDRLSFMVEDANASILLTQESLSGVLPDQQAQVICLDRDWAGIARESTENPESGAAPDNLAYVIYTSGSTGRPKGVQVTHENVCRLLSSTRPWFDFNKQDVWTLFHSFAFDFSVWEIWGALLYGGRLVIVPFGISRSPDEFYALLVRERVTVLNQTPSAFRQLMQAEERMLEAGSCVIEDLALRFVIFGGEALDIASLVSWFARHGDDRPQLINMYGITETTVHVTYRPIRLEDALRPGTGSVIGGGIPDLQVYVLDQYQQLMPSGVIGELYVGGEGVARGYLNRPELTAERFVPDALSGQSGGRLYRSGDLARYRPHGDLEYMGRGDQQVKIRGFRIELGEIESVLNGSAGVKQSVVMVREHAGEKRLVAYVVPDSERPATVNELRHYLKDRLPEYMVPATFVFVEEFVLTDNGKIDRRALPSSERISTEAADEYIAPLTPVEEVLAGIWSEVLGIERVNATDNFFDLGGDSIRSVQVLSKARQRGLSFTYQQLFQYQTIRKLAQQLTATASAQLTDVVSQPFDLISVEDKQRLPEDAEDAYPVTQLQEGMLFHSEYSPGSSVYHNVSSYHLRASFDEQSFIEAVRRLAQRHPVLRTSFDLSSYHEPLQIVHRAVDMALQTTDLSRLSAAEQDERLAAWFEEEKRRKFDWRCAPLIRFHFHRRDTETFQFTMTEHHAILDGWSVASLLTELFQDYVSLLDSRIGRDATAPESLFRDFVTLERRALHDRESVEYWKQKLDGAVITTLPAWSDVVPQQSAARMLQLEVEFPVEVSEGLKRMAQSAALPLKSVLIAAHLKVMSLLSGQTDVLTGMVSHGRDEASDSDRVLGLFLNTVPFHERLRPGSWMQLAHEAFRTEMEMLPFRRYPMIQMQRDHGGQPLFETLFNFIHFHVYESLQKLNSVELLSRNSYAQTNFPLAAAFILDLNTSRIMLNLGADESRIDVERLSAIGSYYRNALTAMARDPLARHDSMSLLPEQELRQQIEEWNETEVAFEGGLVHEWFEQQVKETPEAVALVYENERLSYAELNGRANQLAHYLRDCGVGPERLVGVLLERSVEMVVGLLGVLKAGAAYVPLDPEYPAERLEYMMRDAGASVVLTQERLRAVLPEAPAARVICVDQEWDQIAGASRENEASGATPENLAYVIYTSGSTGRPKGVMITQGALLNHMRWMQWEYGLTAADAVLQKTPFSFDASVWEFYAPLLAGGRLVLARPGGQRQSSYLLDVIEQEQVTVLQVVPTLLQMLMEEEAVSARGRSLRRVYCGGEPLSKELMARCHERLSGAELVNLYGPSEVTIDSVVWRSERGAGRVLIGRPVANLRAYVLDPELQPVPIGVAGELYLAGQGLGRGYLGRPELTAERFVPDPFAGAGGRLYRSGDEARWLASGELEYLGRVDQQVKVRGHRIELGEVETVLSEHGAVRDAVAVIRVDEARGPQVLAYVVGSGVSGKELREWTREKLPDYMVPQAVMVLEELPLLPNGKVDRKRLPEIELVRDETVQVQARDLLELELLRIWEEVLGVERVGVQDDFFELGGHSLLAMRLIARIQQAMGHRLPVELLLQQGTVERLANFLRHEPSAARTSSLVAIQSKGKKPPLFFVHPIGGNVICYANLARQLGDERPFYAFQSQGLFSDPLSTIEEMATQYISEMRRVQGAGPYLLGGWSMGGLVAFEMARQLITQSDEVSMLAMLDTALPQALSDDNSQVDDKLLLRSFFVDLIAPSGGNGNSSLHELPDLDGDEPFSFLLLKVQAAKLLPADVEIEQIRRLYELFKSNLLATRSYRPQPCAVPISLAVAGERRSAKGMLSESQLGWNKVARQQLRVDHLPGNHYTMLRPPHVAALGQWLEAQINEATQRSNFDRLASDSVAENPLQVV